MGHFWEKKIMCCHLCVVMMYTLFNLFLKYTLQHEITLDTK